MIRLMDFIPQGEQAAIIARTSTAQCDAWMASALTAVGSQGGVLHVDPGLYNFASRIALNAAVTIEGEGSGEASPHTSKFLFAAGQGGLLLNVGAQGSVIRGMAIVGDGGAIGHGIEVHTHCKIVDNAITGFVQNGIEVYGDVGSQGTNANGVAIISNGIGSCGGDGIHLHGGDSNVCLMEANDIADCGGWGVNDEGFLGNIQNANEVANCRAGAYRTTGASARHTLTGCYSEGGQPASSLKFPTVVVGGEHGAGFSADTTAMIIREGTITSFRVQWTQAGQQVVASYGEGVGSMMVPALDYYGWQFGFWSGDQWQSFDDRYAHLSNTVAVRYTTKTSPVTDESNNPLGGGKLLQNGAWAYVGPQWQHRWIDFKAMSDQITSLQARLKAAGIP